LKYSQSQHYNHHYLYPQISQENGDIYVVRLTKIKNSKNLAKKDDIESAKNSLRSLNSRSYLDTFFKELESNSFIN